MADEDFQSVPQLAITGHNALFKPTDKVCKEMKELTEPNPTSQQILDICACFDEEPMSDESRKAVSNECKHLKNEQELSQLEERPDTIEQHKPLPPLKHDFIPEEILLSLATRPNSCCHAELYSKSSKDLKQNSIRPTDRVWQHPRRRAKFKYLIDQPISLVRAGRDISFLRDAVYTKCPINVVPESLAAMDKSSVRAQVEKHPTKRKVDVPESLIPDQYHIVKNRGVLGLEYYDDKYTTLLEDHEKKLRVFPSMKPCGRIEAIQLSQVMDDMLEKAGFNDDKKQELRGETQMYYLLDLVKKEQTIYNIVFHELIRQISVDCAERGELLAKVRERYVSLLDYIPRYLTNMHNEIMMQRLLDKELILELFLFQNAVEKLNSELVLLREQDLKATKTIAKTREELSSALIEAHKNANMLDEYHRLYEMQRKRLIAQIDTLTQEKDWWSDAAYSLALKVIEEHNLKLVHDLEISAKLWTTIAHHFVAQLGIKDAEDQAKLQEITGEWRENMLKFTKTLQDAENSSLEKRKSILSGFRKWHEYLSEKKKNHKGLKTIPEEMLHTLTKDLKDWHEMVTQDYERFEGSLFLANKEELLEIVQLQNDWTELSLTLFNRHKWTSDEKMAEQILMEELNNCVNVLCHRHTMTLSGENVILTGTAWYLMKLQDQLESCRTKFDFTTLDEKGMIEFNLLKLSEVFPTLINLMEEAVKLTSDEEVEKMNLPDIREQLTEVNQKIQTFLIALFKMINYKDTKLAQQIALVQSAMSHLLVDILLYVVHDQDCCAERIYFKYLREPNTADKLEEKALMVASQLNILSTQMYSWCRDIVDEMVKQLEANRTENPDHEIKELGNLKMESSEWINVCETLLSGIQGYSVRLLISADEEEQSHINRTRDLCAACLRHSSTNILEMSVSDLYLMLQGKSEIFEEPATIAAFLKTTSTDDTEAGRLGTFEDVEASTSAQLQVKDSTVARESPAEPTGSAEGTVDVEAPIEIIVVEALSSHSKSVMYIGEDTNIHHRDLLETHLSPEKGGLKAVKPVNPKAARNYEGLVEMGVLQKQLIEAEQRALNAEERASSLDASLQEALIKIMDLTQEAKSKVLPPKLQVPEATPGVLPVSTTSVRSVSGMSKLSTKPRGSKSKLKSKKS
ncbi:axonemal dynein light chain domain-containing protein 1 isoform X3 [Leucoraja erinacea]|nr:axonemal dynein light chain domain-containing protein 1 isoform X3 [Leucoraja erinacea]